MKKVGLFLWVLLLFNITSHAQSKVIDSTGLMIIERMSEVITELQSCRIGVTTVYDIAHPELGLIKYTEVADILMKGPDKLLMTLKGDKGERVFSYDGKVFTYYSFENNRYAQIESPGTILHMADTIYSTFGIDFYAIDFFYPDFIDMLIQSSTALTFLGRTTIDGKECFHIAGAAEEFTYQIWIRNDPYFLPEKAVIVFKKQAMNPQFEASYTWETNPVIPDAVFDFDIPPKAVETKVIPVKK